MTRKLSVALAALSLMAAADGRRNLGPAVHGYDQDPRRAVWEIGNDMKSLDGKVRSLAFMGVAALVIMSLAHLRIWAGRSGRMVEAGEGLPVVRGVSALGGLAAFVCFFYTRRKRSFLREMLDRESDSARRWNDMEANSGSARRAWREEEVKKERGAGAGLRAEAPGGGFSTPPDGRE